MSTPSKGGAVLEKVLLAIASAVAGGFFTYGAKVLSIEGRLDGIERSVLRIEQRLYTSPITKESEHHGEKKASTPSQG